MFNHLRYRVLEGKPTIHRIIDHAMHLEPVEPAHRALASLCQVDPELIEETLKLIE